MRARIIRQFLNLPLTEKQILFCYAFRAPIYWIILKTIGFNRFEQVFLNKKLHHDGDADIATAKRYGALANKAVHFVMGRDQCLLRSVMLARTLTKKDYNPAIIFGVQRSVGSFSAHCWVELNGTPINDEPSVGETYHVLRPQ